MMRAATFGFVGLITALACPNLLACPASPAPVRDISLVRYYADKAGTKIDPALKRRHAGEVSHLKQYLDQVTKFADRFVSWRDDGAARCAIRWLKTWAQGRAYLGGMATKQAEYQRKWDLAGLALAYLKIRSVASQNDRDVIEPWLIAIADKARAFFDDRGRKRNNHWYWLGLGLGAVGLATESERHWEAARGIMADAARDITADGSLPMELARGSKALHYHAFAVTALVTLAELAAAQGEDWYGFNDGALHKLVRLTATGLDSPEVFDELTGVAQTRPTKPGSGWVRFYNTTFPNVMARPVPQDRPGHRWLGGKVSNLQRVLNLD